MANKRKKRKSPFGAVLAILLAVCVLCVIGWALLRVNDRYQKRYPVQYTDQIRLSAQENGVPAAFVASIIMAESSYRPEATSSVGARGLMQIMPDTGEWIAGKFGEEFSADLLYQPEVSIRYGAWYLGFLSDRYSGDLTCATAAYHAGQGTVDKWLKDPEYSEDGQTLTKIPSDVTGTYVKRVMGEYYDYYTEKYRELEAEGAY